MTYKFDDWHAGDISPAKEIAAGSYECSVLVTLADGRPTRSVFTGTGTTGNSARQSAIDQAQHAVWVRGIEYDE